VASRADKLAKELIEVRIALGRVSTYEGLVEVSPTAMLVAGLVDDHEALETRIEAVLTYVQHLRDTEAWTYEADTGDALVWPHEALAEIVRLLSGGSIVTDTLENL
jgi:hypothetical protein